MTTAISLFIMTGISLLYSNTRNNLRMQADASFMTENAQFALDGLEFHLRLVGHWGGVKDAAVTGLTLAGCSGFAIPSTLVSLQGYAGGATVPAGPDQCITALADYQRNSDILVVRYALPDAIFPVDTTLSYSLGALVQTPDITSTQTSPATLYRCCTTGIPSTAGTFSAGEWSTLNNAYIVRSLVGKSAQILQTSGTGQLTIPATLPMDRYNTTNHMFKVEIFFIRPCSDQGANGVCDATDDNGAPIPTLVSYSLQDDGTMIQQAVVDGIEMMKLIYGVDTDGDGVPNQYVTAANVSNWSQVVTVQISLVMRSQDFNDRYANLYQQSFSMAGGYTFVPATDSATSATAHIKSYKRIMFTKVVQLRNRIY
ncbi:MAG: PilW family protein [Magnetococcales bacterium]|nr:PilW family protein [Magnetococcales bacterium]